MLSTTNASFIIETKELEQFFNNLKEIHEMCEKNNAPHLTQTIDTLVTKFEINTEHRTTNEIICSRCNDIAPIRKTSNAAHYYLDCHNCYYHLNLSQEDVEPSEEVKTYLLKQEAEQRAQSETEASEIFGK